MIFFLCKMENDRINWFFSDMLPKSLWRESFSVHFLHFYDDIIEKIWVSFFRVKTRLFTSMSPQYLVSWSIIRSSKSNFNGVSYAQHRYRQFWIAHYIIDNLELRNHVVNNTGNYCKWGSLRLLVKNKISYD